MPSQWIITFSIMQFLMGSVNYEFVFFLVIAVYSRSLQWAMFWLIFMYNALLLE